MSIQLPEADTEANVPPSPPRPSLFTRVINSVRIYGIPALNFIIITILATFLLKLTFKYSELYVKNSLITIIVTNLVLYGISETLAQSLLSYKRSAAPLSISTSESWMYTVTSDGGNLYRSNQQAHDEPELNDEDQLERFMDYIQGDNDELTSNPPIDPTQLPANSYFEFGRLAGFMCWGFIMAFAQCLWYKFLQIYATDPKFIEVLRKVLTDQLCYSPISLFCFFTYGTMVLESGTWDDTRAKLRQIYLPTLIVNYTVWFPVQFFNFLVVPRSVQVPFSSSISVLWNCYLSMRNSQS
ncbi:Vacuolar membrane protein [Meyerozyma sp. JA9]|nr:Vacuolar membrane protein [Meyerozyma sp. JA9]